MKGVRWEKMRDGVFEAGLQKFGRLACSKAIIYENPRLLWEKETLVDVKGTGSGKWDDRENGGLKLY
jgi:hypothetical protein